MEQIKTVTVFGKQLNADQLRYLANAMDNEELLGDKNLRSYVENIDKLG